MNLAVTPEQELLGDTLAALCATESSPDRVRRAAETGFDGDRWRRLAETGALGIRVPEEHGGSALGLLEATILNHSSSLPDGKFAASAILTLRIMNGYSQSSEPASLRLMVTEEARSA